MIIIEILILAIVLGVVINILSRLGRPSDRTHYHTIEEIKDIILSNRKLDVIRKDAWINYQIDLFKRMELLLEKKLTKKKKSDILE